MGNGIIKISNFKKTYFYLKKNGLRSAYFAALERMHQEKHSDYMYQPPGKAQLEQQRALSVPSSCLFSILVPVYETNPIYFREMIDSVRGQSYEKWELIIADASNSNQKEAVVKAYQDKRIRYIHLQDNKGISENTNAALEAADGDYIGLLDHDDILTPDALYEMAAAIENAKQEGNLAELLYSDEDKGNADCTEFYEPNWKPDFNKEMLLSNNYICHFLVMKKELIKALKFRQECEGAQDYDLVLRAVAKIEERQSICHIAKILYHWRCHTDSTAENPESKRYAYDAGKRALEDYVKMEGINAQVEHMKHLGFYRISYLPDIFSCRLDVGIVGGKILSGRNRIIGGIFGEDGTALYAGLHKEFSGYMHRASLMQEVDTVDIRCMKVREELWDLFEEVFHVPYQVNRKNGLFDYHTLSQYEEQKKAEACQQFCQKVRAAGYRIIWDPRQMEKI